VNRFQEWREYFINNPEVWDLFVKYSFEAAESRRQRFGVRAISERIRWFCTVETTSNDNFKLNDHHTPYYARLLMWVYPELDGLFSIKDARFQGNKDDILSAYQAAQVLWRENS
jgi:hypothetical protein